jgi:hypothetical protein
MQLLKQKALPLLGGRAFCFLDWFSRVLLFGFEAQLCTFGALQRQLIIGERYHAERAALGGTFGGHHNGFGALVEGVFTVYGTGRRSHIVLAVREKGDALIFLRIGLLHFVAARAQLFIGFPDFAFFAVKHIHTFYFAFFAAARGRE